MTARVLAATRWHRAHIPGFHRHEYYVIVPVIDGRMRIVEGEQESVDELMAGFAYFRPAGIEHDISNGGDKERIFVEVEILR